MDSQQVRGTQVIGKRLDTQHVRLLLRGGQAICWIRWWVYNMLEGDNRSGGTAMCRIRGWVYNMLEGHNRSGGPAMRRIPGWVHST